MKNNVKKFFAALLALIMLLCSASAFAADETDVLKWNIYEPDEEKEYYVDYNYAGVYSGGEEKLAADENGYPINDSVYYNFNAEKDGYYLVTANSEIGFMTVTFPSKYEDGVAHGTAKNHYVGGNTDSRKTLFYLPAGETVIGVDYYFESSFSVEYFGETITDIVFDENAFICIKDYDYNVYNNGETRVTGLDGTIKFSSGKELGLDRVNILIDCEELVKGDNAATVKFIDYSEDVTVTVHEATDIISGVEFGDISVHLSATEYYNGELGYSYRDDSQVTILFADGSKKTVEFEEGYCFIELFGGKEYSVYIQADVDNLKAYVYALGHKYSEYDMDIRPAEFNENLEFLNHNNSVWLSKAECDMNNRLNLLQNTDDIGEKISLLFWIPGIYSNAFFQIFCNIVEFVEFYTGII